jgi:hypothetical protein
LKVSEAQKVTLQWLGEAGNKAEAGQLEDETACLSSNMGKISQKGVCRAWTNYPPFPKAVPMCGTASLDGG